MILFFFTSQYQPSNGTYRSESNMKEAPVRSVHRRLRGGEGILLIKSRPTKSWIAQCTTKSYIDWKFVQQDYGIKIDLTIWRGFALWPFVCLLPVFV